MLYSTANRILNNPQEAEDVAQETIIQYYMSFKIFTIKNISSYLKTICIRKCIDIIRRRKILDSLLEENKNEPVGIEIDDQNLKQILDEEKGRLIEKIKNKIKLLPDGYRVILSLVLFEGYDYEEISNILKISQSGVRSGYNRGRKKLIELLKQ